MTRRTVAHLLRLPPLALCGWAFGQGLQHDLPWLSAMMAAAAACLIASYSLDLLT